MCRELALLTFAVWPGCCLGSGLPRPKLVLALLLLRRLHRHRRRLRISVHARRCVLPCLHSKRPSSHGLRGAAVRGQTLERCVSCSTCARRDAESADCLPACSIDATFEGSAVAVSLPKVFRAARLTEVRQRKNSRSQSATLPGETRADLREHFKMDAIRETRDESAVDD